MEINEYQRLAMKTNNNQLSLEMMLVNSALGLAGETGEVVDLIKKHYFHGHQLDKQLLIKELGDVCWYVAQCCQAIDIDMETVMKQNIDKLTKRYPDGFNSSDSINRKD
ncbi:MAG: nucleoside triphosphate pyrophosphohydrolase family protein [Erysipelotrichaceae bacterium]|nr:nucleoside triphosphate pyrophosphohydrolase family protein [Erysipelotrichaceae bacterium]MDD6640516.1 nucleoside triphosphate pyrophosphohydrolase family protein [Erysipelotrichaceae bacterium]